MRKKSFKITKWYSEAVHRGRTDNTKEKGKQTNNNLQNTTQKTKHRPKRIPQNTEVNSCAP